ncbi:Lrp/AsnC family transcriptional regulator [Desulforhopalus sp. IMCC35007]|uniref:Lrp/AsnC family transcriptional regulator n=1 Tax=Desulforhopalus sp. IMCC35007 TaxID=2569543 RepID=UPI0010ADAEB9|nr:Lrp/AsnC family transcriptional regulator [Desulforhopalus sp. IMCC35007]TKB09436.1 Lrp/AsnC family transcriptional regulator [Desulforhopalus sp. IMCC35007]
MIDNISLEILKILQEKARIPNIEVSRQVGLAPSAVLERVKKMEKMGVIDGYEVTLNPELFNRALIAYIQVSTEKNMDENVGRQLAEITDIQEVHFISGNDCYLVKLRCKDTPALEAVLTKKIKPIPGIISTKTNIVLSTRKESSRFPLPQSF